jgi:hypothetical protein
VGKPGGGRIALTGRQLDSQKGNEGSQAMARIAALSITADPAAGTFEASEQGTISY